MVADERLWAKDLGEVGRGAADCVVLASLGDCGLVGSGVLWTVGREKRSREADDADEVMCGIEGGRLWRLDDHEAEAQYEVAETAGPCMSEVAKDEQKELVNHSLELHVCGHGG